MCSTIHASPVHPSAPSSCTSLSGLFKPLHPPSTPHKPPANHLRPSDPKFAIPLHHHPNPLAPERASTLPPSSSSTPPQHTPSTTTAPSSLRPSPPTLSQNKTPTSHPATTKQPPPSIPTSPSLKPPPESTDYARKSSDRPAGMYWKSAVEREGIARIMIWGK